MQMHFQLTTIIILIIITNKNNKAITIKPFHSLLLLEKLQTTAKMKSGETSLHPCFQMIIIHL